VKIVNDDSGIISKWSFKHIDNIRVIIYDRHMFIIQVTGLGGCMSGALLCGKDPSLAIKFYPGGGVAGSNSRVK
jgi:hypothetical protein